MSQLVNATLAPYHQTAFPREITLHPIPFSTGHNGIPNVFDSQLYLPIKNKEVDHCIEKLQKLNDWPENWDDYGAQQPKSMAVNFAINLVWTIFDFSRALGWPWMSPSISADSSGDVLLEWWGKNDKKITLYLNENNQIEYIKSFTPNVSEMEDGVLNNFDISIYQELFGWLIE